MTGPPARKSRTAPLRKTVPRLCKFLDFALVVALVGACTHRRDELPKFGAEFMLPQAEGVKLGSTRRDLIRERRAILADSYSTWETMDGARSNVFWFSLPSDPGRADAVASDESYLSAVTMTQQFDKAEVIAYLRRVDSIGGAWTQLANTEPDTLKYQITPVGSPEPAQMRVLVWRASPVIASLEYVVSPPPHLPSYLIRATVQDERIALALTHPHWPAQDR